MQELAPSLNYWPPDRREQANLEMVDLVAKRSRDSTQVGFVLTGSDHVIKSVGWNDFSRGINDDVRVHPERRQRPPTGTKYKWTEHAERNAIYNAARNGVSTVGSYGYMRWFPCCDCARCLIQAGVIRLYCGEPNWNDATWGEDFMISRQMLFEAGVSMIVLTNAPPQP